MMSDGASMVLKLKAQIYCGDEIAMGPGKASLLEAIIRDGSISAAGRSLGMSYRRTWLLVDVMNRCWSAPLVETVTGGAKGGGAKVTALGEEILKLYRDLEKAIDTARSSVTFEELGKRLAEMPRPPAHPASED